MSSSTANTPTSAIPIPSSSMSGASTPSSSPSSASSDRPWSRRRESLLSSSFSRAEYSTVEMGVRDGSTRVIAYVKTSQGFDWNQDIFLPSSSDITLHNGINRPESVHDIILTDEDRFLPS